MIAGLESVSGGSIAFDGKEVNRLPPKGRDIAMVFQSYALYPHMTVFSNMAFGLKLSGVDRAQIGERVRAAAELLNISELLRRRPRELSGGQRQRVAMGRAHRPPAAGVPLRRAAQQTSTPTSARRCGSRSSACTASSGPPWSMSPMTRWRR